MTQVLDRQPRWLDHGSAGFQLFQPQKSDVANQEDQQQLVGPQKKIAHRGTEVFVAVGNEIRWSDLAVLRDAEQKNEERGRKAEGMNTSQGPERAYKVLKTPVVRPIRQISVSPSGDLIAILTTHTCHICVLPASEHLRFQDASPLKLRYFQVGPTAHILEQSPIVSALWHPLSTNGNGLVTITRDACVRLWELETKNRSSFNEPALAVDLKKLANATSMREDLSASKYGVNRGFSPDDVEMQVAAGCFGGLGSDEEDGWSGMTLWVAMAEGDVYALCPFLPSYFQVPANLLPSLSTSVVMKWRATNGDAKASEADKRVSDQQYRWLGELDAQVAVQNGSVDRYKRPERLGAIPRLQGPFQLVPEPDFGEVTDIHVVAPKIDDDDLFDDDEYGDFRNQDGVSVGILLLATNTSQVHVCLNLQGVEADWLPHRRSRAYGLDEADDDKELLLFETLDFATNGPADGDASWPTFTTCPHDRYEVLVTQAMGVYTLSMRSWIEPLEDELSATQDGTQGVEFRMDRFMESASTAVELVTPEIQEPLPGIINTAIALLDPATSVVIILSSAASTPFAAVLHTSLLPPPPFAPDRSTAVITAGSLPVPALRVPYQPANIFSLPSALPSQATTWAREAVPGSAADLKTPLRFSPFTLQKITDAHRVLSSETHLLGLAAADLFRRCERMIAELRAQIDKVKDLAHRVDSVSGDDEFPGPAQPTHSTAQPLPDLVRGGKEKISARTEACQARNVALNARVEALQKKLATASAGKPLSLRERAFAAELNRLNASLSPAPSSSPSSSIALLRMQDSDITTTTASLSSDSQDSLPDSLASRFRIAQETFVQLTAQAAKITRDLPDTAARASPPATVSRRSAPAAGVASDFRAQKLAHVLAMLDRESALVDAVAGRLEGLQLAVRAARG